MLEKRQAIIEKKKLEKKSNAGLLKENLKRDSTISCLQGKRPSLWYCYNIQIADELGKTFLCYR